MSASILSSKNRARHFRFLNLLNFVAAGFDYVKYLKAFECELTKRFLPYEWMESSEKLGCISLSLLESFCSSLRDEDISVENYDYCQKVWTDGNMKTFKDFLVWYNKTDVVPFLEALDKQVSVYADRGIDMLGSRISLSGLSVC